MNLTEGSYAQADLRFLLPLTAGQSIGVLGDARPLVSILEENGLSVTSLSSCLDQPLSIVVGVGNHADLDHIIVPEFFHDSLGSCLTHISQWLKPGGWLLIGFHNSESLYRPLLKKDAKNKPRFSLRKCTRALEKSGFRVVCYYGTYDKLQNPRVLIPLDNKPAVDYFFRSIYTPISRSLALLQPLALLLANTGFQRVLFRGFVIVAQRETHRDHAE